MSYIELGTEESDIGGAEGLLKSAASRINDRRGDAVRLGGDDRSFTLADDVSANIPPLAINFVSLDVTGSLVTEGTDADRNCFDDVSGKRLTCLQNIGGTYRWSLAIGKDTLVLPEGWAVATDKSQLGSVPLISGAGRGVFVTEIGFDAEGRALARTAADSGNWQSFPPNADPSADAGLDKSPFWAVYFVPLYKSSGSKNIAVAVGVHPSGYVEMLRYDGAKWLGFGNRNL